jgi:5-methylcytosine-specific restriction endonuclease McrA
LSSKDQSFNDNSKKRCKSPELYVDDIEQEVVWERDGYICQICYNPVDKSLPWHDAWSAVTDHIIMLFEWGEHSYANVRLAHNKCNKARKKKRDETPGEMTNRHSKKPTNRHNEKQEQAKGIAIAGT